MAKANRLEVKRGTVLAIPLKDDAWALGQVIFPGISFYIGVGLSEYKEPLSAKDIDRQKLELFSWTNDAELFKKRWRNLGVFDVQEHGKLPEYKVTISGKMIVESFLGSKLRDYDPGQDQAIQFKTSRSPLLFQDIVQAAFGIGEWKEFYDRAKI